MNKEVYAVVAAMDLPSFQKGDIISSSDDSFDRYEKLKGNPKFCLIRVDGITKEEAEALLSPLIVNNDGEMELLYNRSLTVDVDKLTGLASIFVDELLSLISQKAVI